MKTKLNVLLIFAGLMLASIARAESHLISCDNLKADDQILALVMEESSLRQVRIFTNGNMSYPRVPQFLEDQGSASVYRLLGSSSLMFVDNTVLQGQGGNVRMESSEFVCDGF